MAESKAAFRRRLGRVLNILTEATLDGAGDTSTFICSELVDYFTSDDTLTGAFIYDVSGKESRTVDSWTVSTTGTGTVLRPFTASQASGRSIEIYEQFSPKVLDAALRMAMDEAYAYIVIEILDDSIEVEADVYEYPIPDNMRDFSRMSGGIVTYSSNEDIETWPRNRLEFWETKTSGTDVVLVLPSIAGLIGKTLQLTGKGIPSFPTVDTTLLPFRSDTLQLLAFKAAEIVWRTGPALSGKDADFAAGQEAKWAAKFDEKRDQWGTELEPGILRSPEDQYYRNAPLAYNHRTPS